MFNTFLKGICQKVTVIAWVEFELAYFEAAVQHFCQYDTVTPSSQIMLQGTDYLISVLLHYIFF